jgi:hypothetical protein
MRRHTVREQSDSRFAYEKLLQVRDLDNQLMWSRVTAMLTVEGLLFAFLSNAYSNLFEKNFEVLIITIILGFGSSVFFYCLISGSDWWISWWQSKIHNLEKEHHVIGNLDIFKTHPQFVDKSDKKWKIDVKDGGFKGYTSTRKTILLISVSFSLAWIAILIISYWKKFFP